MAKIPNRGFTSLIGIFRLGEISASSRVLCVGEYFSIKPKKEELKQILVYYDKKKSEENKNFTLSYNSNTIEMTGEDARSFVTPLGKEIVKQDTILGYDGLKLVGKVEDRATFEKDDSNKELIEYLVNSMFCDIEILMNTKTDEEREKFYKATSNLVKKRTWRILMSASSLGVFLSTLY